MADAVAKKLKGNPNLKKINKRRGEAETLLRAEKRFFSKVMFDFILSNCEKWFLISVLRRAFLVHSHEKIPSALLLLPSHSPPRSESTPDGEGERMTVVVFNCDI